MRKKKRASPKRMKKRTRLALNCLIDLQGGVLCGPPDNVRRVRKKKRASPKRMKKIKGPDNPTCVFFRKSVAVDTIGSLSKGTSECASVSQ